MRLLHLDSRFFKGKEKKIPNTKYQNNLKRLKYHYYKLTIKFNNSRDKNNKINNIHSGNSSSLVVQNR